MFNKIFDEYERKARLYPALITLLPLVFDVYLIVPEIRNLSNTLVTLFISLGLLQLLAIISRNKGKNKENALYILWSGAPATRFLRHADSTIDPITKNRYHNFLMKSISNYIIPASEDEATNITSSDIIYESGVRWLREKTRDKKIYPLVFKENIGYGFSRNLWAMKTISIVILILSIIMNFIIFYIKEGLNISSYSFEFWIANGISVLLLFIWIIFINKSMVKNAAESYARALLATCDEI